MKRHGSRHELHTFLKLGYLLRLTKQVHCLIFGCKSGANNSVIGERVTARSFQVDVTFSPKSRAKTTIMQSRMNEW